MQALIESSASVSVGDGSRRSTSPSQIRSRALPRARSGGYKALLEGHNPHYEFDSGKAGTVDTPQLAAG